MLDSVRMGILWALSFYHDQLTTLLNMWRECCKENTQVLWTQQLTLIINTCKNCVHFHFTTDTQPNSTGKDLNIARTTPASSCVLLRAEEWSTQKVFTQWFWLWVMICEILSHWLDIFLSWCRHATQQWIEPNYQWQNVVVFFLPCFSFAFLEIKMELKLLPPCEFSHHILRLVQMCINCFHSAQRKCLFNCVSDFNKKYLYSVLY